MSKIVITSQTQQMETFGPNGNNKTIGLKRTALGVNGRRIPLTVSLRQNKVQTNDVDHKAIGNPIVKQAGMTRMTRFKTSKVPVVNDENAEADNGLASKLIAGKSKIPVDVLKKCQTVVSKRIKSKTESKSVSNAKSKASEELGFSSNLLPISVEDIDANDSKNVFLTPDYVNDIYAYLRHLENEQNIRSNFLSVQREMTPRMRSVLVDWLINVHHQFRLLPETLYLGISIMDRFFQKEVISKEKIQLVGVTAFFIASKFEEIYPPDIKDFVMICDKLYHKRDIIKMEMGILKALQFELGRPLPLHFLRRNSKAAHADSRIHALAKYLMELTLVDYECAHWKPSLLAAVSLYVTLRVLADSDDSTPKWTSTLEYYSTYSEQQLLSSASLVCKLIIKSEKSKFQNCRKKYSSAKLMEISKIPQLKSAVIEQIAAITP